MKWLKYAQVPISRIIAPGDITARMRERHVKELADSYDDTGGEPGNSPWVTARWELVSGRDRFAAARLRKAKTITVRVGEFTVVEIIRAKAIENLRRRTIDKATEMAEMERELALALAAESGTRVPGKREIRDARKAIAEAAQVQPASVKKAVQRARAKASSPEKGANGAAGPPPVGVAPERQAAETSAATASREGAAAPLEGSGGSRQPPPPIETYGLHVSDGVLAHLGKVRAVVDQIDRGAQRAQAALTSIAGPLEELDVVALDAETKRRLRDDANRLRDQLHTLASAARGAKPAALCPYCKGLQWIDDRDCVFCYGLGYSSVRALDGVTLPRELLRKGAAAMVTDHRGGFVSYESEWARSSARRNVATAGGAVKHSRKQIAQLDDGTAVYSDEAGE